MNVNEKVILIIDDDAGVAILCQRILERKGFEVISVTNPKQGLAILHQARIDLLLVDIRMPEMDGFEVIERARAHLSDLAIVVMTGYGTVETAIQALRLGANGLILKPFKESDELVMSVQLALEETERQREMARLQAMRPLIDITQTLFSEINPDKLIDLALDAMVDHLGCKQTAIYKRVDNAEHLTLIAGRGDPSNDEKAAFDSGPVARAEVWGAPIRADLREENDPGLVKALEDAQLTSVMCAPVMRGMDEQSVILAGRGGDQPEFTEADFEMFTIFARQLSVAMENAYLYQELRETIRQVEASQEALIQAEKMSALGRITASIAHEINNPLQAVSNSLHLAQRNDLGSKKRRYYLDLSQGELKRLMDTVQQMLDFSRPGLSRKTSTDINLLLKKIFVLLAQQLATQKIQINTIFSEDLPPVLAVKNQLQQVFFNITLNSMEAMPEGGKIEIRTKKVKDGVEITFQDNGPGISAEIRERIFEPFMSTKDLGTGLGLSVSYSIIEAHGGKLDLSSVNGHGACFRVVLPLEVS